MSIAFELPCCIRLSRFAPAMEQLSNIIFHESIRCYSNDNDDDDDKAPPAGSEKIVIGRPSPWSCHAEATAASKSAESRAPAAMIGTSSIVMFVISNKRYVYP